MSLRDLVSRVVCALGALAVAAVVQAADVKLSANDRHFINEAAAHAHATVELGRLVQQSGVGVETKQLAQRLVDEHEPAARELEELAGKLGVTPPKEPNVRQKGEIKRLAKLAGGEFDREVASHVVREQERTAALYEKQATRGDSPELKAYAARLLPTLQEHVKLARAVSGLKK